jgi:hypothetical protein
MTTDSKRSAAGWLLLFIGVAVTSFFGGRHSAAVDVQSHVDANVPGNAARPTARGVMAAPAQRGASVVAPAQDSSEIAIPRRWQFAGIASTRSARNSEEWFARYPERMDEIRAYNFAHPYAWNAKNADEIAWKAQNGFPTVEEVLRANQMSDADLKALADAGGEKAQILYADRLASERGLEAKKSAEQGGSPGDFSKTHPDLEAEWTRMWKVVRQIDSPYVGYMEAARSMWFDDSAARAQTFAAGMALAYFRGDDSAASGLLSADLAGYLTRDQADLAYRIVAEFRDYHPLPDGCGPPVLGPFPKPQSGQ